MFRSMHLRHGGRKHARRGTNAFPVRLNEETNFSSKLTFVVTRFGTVKLTVRITSGPSRFPRVDKRPSTPPGPSIESLVTALACVPTIFVSSPTCGPPPADLSSPGRSRSASHAAARGIRPRLVFCVNMSRCIRIWLSRGALGIPRDLSRLSRILDVLGRSA